MIVYKYKGTISKNVRTKAIMAGPTCFSMAHKEMSKYIFNRVMTTIKLKIAEIKIP